MLSEFTGHGGLEEHFTIRQILSFYSQIRTMYFVNMLTSRLPKGPAKVGEGSLGPPGNRLQSGSRVAHQAAAAESRGPVRIKGMRRTAMYLFHHFQRARLRAGGDEVAAGRTVRLNEPHVLAA